MAGMLTWLAFLCLACFMPVQVSMDSDTDSVGALACAPWLLVYM